MSSRCVQCVERQPWPVIAGFLASLSPGSIGIDSGTGNGKYLPLDQDGKIMTLGLDRSLNLLKIAQTNSIRTPRNTREVLLGDALDCCWRRGSFVRMLYRSVEYH